MDDARKLKKEWRGRQRAFLLTAEQHRRMAALLRRGTAPHCKERALLHERLAASIDRRDAEKQWVENPVRGG